MKQRALNAFKSTRDEQMYVFCDHLEFLTVQDHILESVCRHQEENHATCQLCKFEKQLGLPHLPEMVFPYNTLCIRYKGQPLIEFNALDALQHVDKTKLPNIKVSSTSAWQNARNDILPTRNIQHSFDWTYTSNYQGTIDDNIRVEFANESEAINYERLKRKDPIQFYSQLTLYEDELADNGCAQMSVRVRVMPDTFFCLCRFYLRVDHVMVRIYDTRIYGEAENDTFAIREWTKREANYSQLSKEALDCVLDPQQLCTHLQPILCQRMKIFYPS